MRWENSTLGSHCSELQVPCFFVNKRTKGMTVTPQGPKEESVAARVNDEADDFNSRKKERDKRQSECFF